MKRVFGGIVCGLVVLLTGSLAWAQVGATAQISGTVRDQSGGVLPGADVTVTQTDTGLKRNAISEVDGSYVIPSLPVGPYRLEVVLQGFRSYQRTGIVLQVGSNPIINVSLELGQIAETVTVQANASMVATRNTGVSQVMDNKRILDLPLNGRNSADLIANLPAAIPLPSQNASSRSMQGGVAYAVAGGQTYGVSYVLDGAMHNNPYDNLNLPLPFPDALQEFRAETSAMTAQNGMHSGAAVNAVTKSGTNQFRGDVFEFLRDHRFNSRNIYNARNPDGSLKDDGLKRNQYGGTIGGPIKSDRVFFFVGYQGTNVRITPTDNRAYIPTPAMLAGDFTAFTSPACNGGRQITLRDPFVNNRVDPSRFSRAALNIVSKLPTTNDSCGLLLYGLPSASDQNEFVSKIDYQVNEKHSLFGRYSAMKYVSPPPFSAAGDNILATRIGGRDNLAQMFTFGENYIISPTTLNALRFAFNRTAIHRTSTDFFSAPEVGINIYSYRPHYMLLTVGTAGTTGFQLGGGTESESHFTTNAYQASDDITLVRGAHQLSFGGNIARWTSLSLANVRSPGQLSVDGSITGLPLSDFLLGRLGVNGLVQAAPNTLDMEQTYFGVYGQDAWRIGSKVTLNYGVRWEPFYPQQLRNGAVYQFDMTRFQQNVHSTVFPKAPAGLYFPGDPGFPTKAGMLTQWKNVAPRVGIAWDPSGDGRTSIRASYAKAFEFVNGQFHLNTSVAPPWGSEVRINSPAGGLDNPFLGSGQANIFPVTFDQNAPFSPNGPFLSLSNDMTNARVHLWNAGIERQISPAWFVSASYVGSRTLNILESTPLNNGLFRTVNGQAPSNANLNARRPLTLADPVNGAFYGPIDLYVTDGEQRYKGLLLSVRRNVVRGLGLTANYTLSRCDGAPEGGGGGTTNVSSGYNKPNDPHFDDGYCVFDRRHLFTMTMTYQTPDTWGMAGSGWRFAGSFKASSGPWLTVNPGVDVALNGQATTQRVNQILDNPYLDTSLSSPNGQYLNPAAFARAATGTLGTMPRNSLLGVASKNLDVQVTRVFRLTTSQGIEVRVEAFNALNWIGWGIDRGIPGQTGQPVTNFNAGNFGQIVSAGDPRIMQFAVKYTF